VRGSELGLVGAGIVRRRVNRSDQGPCVNARADRSHGGVAQHTKYLDPNTSIHRCQWASLPKVDAFKR
jgi:hypothetical protein